ncbi:MAG TPA: hypothetical protein VE090_06070 [Methylomirabilota bacterium]|nr:hypothetical protein [Methylomirabilota bacterium]
MNKSRSVPERNSDKWFVDIIGKLKNTTIFSPTDIETIIIEAIAEYSIGSISLEGLIEVITAVKNYKIDLPLFLKNIILTCGASFVS